MSMIEKCPKCGATSPVVQNGLCGGCGANDSRSTEEKTIATLVEDRDTAGQYRVEAEDDDGGMEVSIFAGPGALDRAIFFASEYHDGWNDPQGLAGY
jgi:ribosomal protein L37E